ncbi:MAG: hypothetical protein RLZZ440_2115 [Planctomycetota bacterium]
MERLARTIRLVTGLGMVAAGTSLAAPAAIELHRWWQAMSRPNVATPWPAGAAAPTQVSASVDPRAELPPAGLLAGERAADPVSLDRDYVLPPPPAPLPPVASGGSQPAEPLAVAYRSTLDVPPPPLLDGQQPPPLATGWSARQPDPVGYRPPPAAQAMVYVIRDGDDLTGIATRFYGHPAAAAAIWDANRGLLPDPAILPIGATLLLPHPDVIGGLVQAGPRAPTIEPIGSPGGIRAVGQRRP